MIYELLLKIKSKMIHVEFENIGVNPIQDGSRIIRILIEDI